MSLVTNPFGLPGGAEFTLTSHRSSSHHEPAPCRLLQVFVNDNDAFTFPCLPCSGFTNTAEYKLDFCKRLVDAISNALVLPPYFDVRIALIVCNAVLLPVNACDGRHIVRIQVRDDECAVRDRRREWAAWQWEIKMSVAKRQLEISEGARDKAEKEWKESRDDHECAICIKEIESVMESLKLPCSHIFHEKCVVRWLDINPVCPLCRFDDWSLDDSS